jgi:hypothetical protein
MLNPIDAEAVIRDSGAIGRFPGEIHEGVAWWVASCFVVASEASRLAVGCDTHPVTAEFFRRFCRGAINARSHACTVTSLATVDESVLLGFLQDNAPLVGAYLSTTTEADGIQLVRITLYDQQSQPLCEDTGLAEIRRMIAEDRVPIPVNEHAKGHIEPYVPTDRGATK